MATQLKPDKTETQWPLACLIRAHQVSSGIWSTTQWQLERFGLQVTPLESDEILAVLRLHRDERTDYRFNLSSQAPKLFVILDNIDSELPQLVDITASQSVAAQYMDGDYLVLSKPMPLPVQAWLEAFIGRHGELLEQRRKKRKGAGRSSGK